MYNFMKDLYNWIQIAITAAGGFAGAFLGGIDGFVYALIVMIIIDYILGVMTAVAEKKLSSAAGFRGIAKKIMILAFVGVGAVIDTHILKNGGIVRTSVIFFYFANEGISIIENASALGLPVPERLREVLEQLRDDSNSTTDDKKDEEKGND